MDQATAARTDAYHGAVWWSRVLGKRCVVRREGDWLLVWCAEGALIDGRLRREIEAHRLTPSEHRGGAI